MNYKSIFIAVAVVVVTFIMGFGASAQTKGATSKIDPRLIGEYSGKYCSFWHFKEDGTGVAGAGCDVDAIFSFTTENGKIKFSNAKIYDEYDRLVDTKIDDRSFSFSDEGETLSFGKETFKRGCGCCC